MQKTMIKLTTLKLVGITTRTNNAQIFERDPATNEITVTVQPTDKITATIQKYFHNGLAKKINNRKNPGTTFCVYCIM